MSSIASIQIVDFVLKTLYESKNPLGMDDGAIYGVLVKEFRELDGNPIAVNKLLSTLKTLERENLIYGEHRTSFVTKKERKHYFLSLEGELLIERGGYKERLNDINDAKEKIRLQHKFNYWIAVSSVGLIIIGILDLFKKDETRVLQDQSIQVKLGEIVLKQKDTCVHYQSTPKKKTK